MIIFWDFIYPTKGEPLSRNEDFRNGLSYHHDTSPHCNTDYAHFDAVLSYVTTALFYILLIPYMHMLLRTFAPGLPRVRMPVERVTEFHFESATGDNVKLDGSRDALPFGLDLQARRRTAGKLAAVGHTLRRYCCRAGGCCRGLVDYVFGEEMTPPGRGLRVGKVAAKSLAEEHNVKEGWRLISVNDHEVHSLKEDRERVNVVLVKSINR